MWECYTRTSEAVAVRTTYSALKECLPEYVDIGVVRYIDYANQSLPSMNMFEYIMHKDSYFEFEREVRAVAAPPAVPELGLTNFCDNLFESEMDASIRVYAPTIDLTKLVHGVVLHPAAVSDFRIRVAQLCSSNGLPTPDERG